MLEEKMDYLDRIVTELNKTYREVQKSIEEYDKKSIKNINSSCSY